MSVTRPLNNNGQGAGELSAKERKQLDQENGRARFDLNSQAKPGAKFSRTDFLKLAQLQAISGRKGRVNSAQVRAKSTDDVAAVEKRSDASTPSATSTEGSSDDQSL